MFWEVDQWNVALSPSLFYLLNAKLIRYVPWDLKKNQGTDRSSMFCFAADPERLPDCDDAALNFPINIRRASNFQTGPLSEDEFSPFFFRSAQVNVDSFHSTIQLENKQSNHVLWRSLDRSDIAVCEGQTKGKQKEIKGRTGLAVAPITTTINAEVCCWI